HPDMIYFLTRFGLVQAAVLEDRPGIPPSPQHLANVIRQIKDERIKVILVEPWNDVKLANRVGEESGAKAIVVASAVGAVKGADNYIAPTDFTLKPPAGALRYPPHDLRPVRDPLGAVSDVSRAHRHSRLPRRSRACARGRLRRHRNGADRRARGDRGVSARL